MTKPYLLVLLAAMFGRPVMAQSANEPGVFSARPVNCPPGCTIVEEIRYREVCKKVCHIEPNVRKIKVPCYDMKCEDICKLRCGRGDPISCKRDRCDCSPPDEYDAPPKGCGRIRERRVLIKREVDVEHHHFKCVIENVVQLVPFKVYRQVSCENAAAEVHAEDPSSDLRGR